MVKNLFFAHLVQLKIWFQGTMLKIVVGASICQTTKSFWDKLVFWDLR